MKKYQSIFWSIIIVLITGLSFSACCEEEYLSTDQYGNEIKLNSFGPCPVLRGGTLRFLGSNLDQITEIDLPGADPITTIDVIKSGNVSEIQIQVPKEKCDTGIVTLKTAKGGIIKTLTPVTYEENIKLEKVYIGQEGNLTGNVGDIVTFKGDYLNLINAVIFADNDTVKADQFTAHDRYTICVPISKVAKTGRPQLSDGTNSIYADDAIIISLPTASAVTPSTVKAWQTVTVTGENLNLIKTISLVGADIDSVGITRAADGKSLTFQLPEAATDGEVTLNTYSGVQIPAGKIVTVVPTDLVASPNPVKNGEEITITGKDLDLVASIAFNTTAGEIKTKSETSLTAVVPEDVQDGNITLTLANGKSVTVAYTLVKPTVTECNPSSLMAGNKVVIRGTDLDLVKSVTFPGETPQVVSEFTAQNANAIALTVPAAAVGQGFTLTLKNGLTVESNVLTITPATDPAVSEIGNAVIGKEVTIKGKNFNNVENVYIGTTKVTKYSGHSDSELTFTVPATVEAGTYDLIMENYEGTKFTVSKITAVPAETTLWSGALGPCDWSGAHKVEITDAMKANLKAGKTLGFDFECDASQTYWQIEVITSWWTDLPSFTAYNGGARPILTVDPSNPKLEIQITQEDIDLLLNQGNVFLFVGNGCIVKRIYVK